jgi:hypothetical protein
MTLILTRPQLEEEEEEEESPFLGMGKDGRR